MKLSARNRLTGTVVSIRCGQAIAACAPSWPWPLMTNGMRPARLRTHIRSSTARAVAMTRYMPMRSSSVSPTEAARSETPSAFDEAADFEAFVVAIRS